MAALAAAGRLDGFLRGESGGRRLRLLKGVTESWNYEVFELENAPRQQSLWPGLRAQNPDGVSGHLDAVMPHNVQPCSSVAYSHK